MSTARPKLLMVSRSTPLHPGAGGMEEISWQLARDLCDEWAVEVLTSPIPGHKQDAFVDGITVRAVARGRPGRYGPAWWWQSARDRAARDADVVLSVSAGATAMLWRRTPVFIFQAHGTALAEAAATLRLRPRLWAAKAVRSLWWAAVDSVVYRRADVVVAASEHVRTGLVRPFYRRAWTRTRLLVIANGVPGPTLGEDAPRRAAGADIVAVTVSRLTHQKGVDRCIGAMVHAHERTELVVVGEGDEAAGLRAQAERLGVAERVRFVGRLSRGDVVGVLSTADIFVFPARGVEREGLPLALLEALASGVPVLVPVESKWPDDLSAVVEFVDMDDPEKLAREIAAKSRKRSSTSLLPRRYSADGMHDAYRELLAGLLSDRAVN